MPDHQRAFLGIHCYDTLRVSHPKISKWFSLREFCQHLGLSLIAIAKIFSRGRLPHELATAGDEARGTVVPVVIG